MSRTIKPLVVCMFVATSLLIIFVVRDNYNWYLTAKSTSIKKWTRMSTGTTQNTVSKDTTKNISKPLSVKDIQQQRYSNLLEACERLNSKERRDTIDGLTADILKKMNHIFVLDKLKTLYCYIPKVGCTTMKRMLLLLNGNINSTNIDHETVHILAERHFPSLSKFSLEDSKEKIKSYRKLIFVREPFSRILSAYRDKLDSNGAFRNEYWSRIINGHAKPGVSRNKDVNITFGSFVNYVGNPSHTLALPQEEHWREFHRLCHPCKVSYDVIGHFETFYEDVREGLQEIAKGVDVEIPKSSNPTKSSRSEVLVKYYSQVSSSQLESLYQRLATDIEIFDYRVPSFIAGRINTSRSNM
ncbi:carbohydrate sulfotransferase 11-like [Lytechinus variegatus]|uniref:carbohydrate sulfotransferase 11-like n=1 Tax=Lytechinus variegatus TaxID=7654 RepID=UPI001BB221EF|nr:carbohydrate sulfotransferase 11-like [Lytechinus variegatus]